MLGHGGLMVGAWSIDNGGMEHWWRHGGGGMDD